MEKLVILLQEFVLIGRITRIGISIGQFNRKKFVKTSKLNFSPKKWNDKRSIKDKDERTTLFKILVTKNLEFHFYNKYDELSTKKVTKGLRVRFNVIISYANTSAKLRSIRALGDVPTKVTKEYMENLTICPKYILQIEN